MKHWNWATGGAARLIGAGALSLCLIALCPGHGRAQTPPTSARPLPTASTKSFAPAAIDALPGLQCKLYPTGGSPATGLAVFTDDDGYARFYAVRAAAGDAVQLLTLECRNPAGDLSSYSVDLTSAETFAPRPLNLATERGTDRPALAGDPLSYTQLQLIQAGYGLRPDPAKDPAAYSRWRTAASVPGRILEAKRPLSHSHNVATTTGPWWVGTELRGAPNYLAVEAVFNVPKAVPGGDQTSTTAIGIWNGLGGIGSSGLIQGGVGVQTTPAIATYSTWREYCCGDTNASGNGGNFVPSPGDQIYSQAWYCDSQGNVNINGGYGCTYLADLTSGAVFNCTSATGSPCSSVAALPLCSVNPKAPNCMVLGGSAEFVIEGQSPQVWPCSTAFTDLTPTVTMAGSAISSQTNSFSQTISTPSESVTLLTDFTNTTTHMTVTLGTTNQTNFTVSKSPDLQIHELRLQGGWQQANLATLVSDNPPALPAAGKPFSYVTPDGIPRTVYRGTDGHVHELRLQGSWQQADLSASVTDNPPASPAACDPFAYVTPDGIPRVVYLGGDSHIHELRLQGSWQQADLSAIVTDNAPAAAAAGSPFAYVTPDGIPRVVYVGTDGHIHELRLQGSWQQADLSAIVTDNPPAAAAAGNPFAYVTPDGIPRVVYVGGDTHIHELRLQGNWQQADLSAIVTNSPPPVTAAAGNSANGYAQPFAYVTRDGIPRVVYLGADGHIHELRLQGSWQQTDLSATVTNDPPASAAAYDPIAYVTPDGIPRVVYLGGDSHIHELRLEGSWQQADLSAEVTDNPPAAPALNPISTLISSSLSAYVTRDSIPRVVYVAGACGDANQPCCTTGNACGGGLSCDGNNQCTCGGLNQPCCATGASCGAGLSCDSNNQCGCGGLNQTCCSQGSPCKSGLACSGNRAPGSLPPAYTCVTTCGYQGESCCGGSSCNGGLACVDGTCACGGENQRCCEPNGTCSFNFTCADGFCHPSTSGCAECRQQLTQCLNRCGRDAQCQCLCRNSQTSCFEQNNCGLPSTFENCGPLHGELGSTTGPVRASARAEIVEAPALQAATDEPAPMTKSQTTAILEELKQIRQLLQARRDAGMAAPPPSPPAPQQVEMSIGASVYALGRSNAPVTMIEFTDYQCPYCRKFHLETFQRLKQAFIDTGELRYVTRDLPLPMHEHALKAAGAARCAGDQGEFWELRDGLIAHAADLGDDAIIKLAQPLVGDLALFRQCFADDRHRGDIEADIAAAASLGIGGTPTFVIGTVANDHLVGTEVIGAQPFAVFEKAIRTTLAAIPR